MHHLILSTLCCLSMARVEGCEAEWNGKTVGLVDDCDIFEESLTITLSNNFKSFRCIKKLMVNINTTATQITEVTQAVKINNTIEDRCKEATLSLMYQDYAGKRGHLSLLLDPMKCFKEESRLTFTLEGEEKIGMKVVDEALKTSKMRPCLLNLQIKGKDGPVKSILKEGGTAVVSLNRTVQQSLSVVYSFKGQTKIKMLDVPRAELVSFGDWSLTQHCSQPCGPEGRRIELRACDAISGSSCDPALFMRESDKPCENNRKCSDGFSDWSKWSECSIDCAESTTKSGNKTRRQRCEDISCGEEDDFVQSMPCWGNPDPTYCTTGLAKHLVYVVSLDCSILSSRVSQTTAGRNFKIEFNLTRPEEDTVSKIILLANTTSEDSEPKVGMQTWKLTETAKDSPFETLIKGYYDQIDMSCNGCTMTSSWCNCTIKNIKQQQNYSVSVKVEETLKTAGGLGAETTRVTHCPIHDKNTDSWFCDFPNNKQSIPAKGICDGTDDCENKRDEEDCKPNEYLVVYPVLGLFLVASVIATLSQQQRQLCLPCMKDIEEESEEEFRKEENVEAPVEPQATVAPTITVKDLDAVDKSAVLTSLTASRATPPANRRLPTLKGSQENLLSLKASQENLSLLKQSQENLTTLKKSQEILTSRTLEEGSPVQRSNSLTSGSPTSQGSLWAPVPWRSPVPKRKTSTEGTSEGVPIEEALEALDKALYSPYPEAQTEAQLKIKSLDEETRFKLVTTTHKLVKGGSKDWFKKSIAIVFEVEGTNNKSETKAALLKYKRAKYSTKAKVDVYKEAENKLTHRIKSQIKVNTVTNMIFVVLSALYAWVNLLFIEVKDLLAIAGFIYFNREVLFGRNIQVDNIRTEHFLYSLVATFVVSTVWKIFMCFKVNVQGSKYKIVLKIIPFYTEVCLLQSALEQQLRILKIEREITEELSKKGKTNWAKIVSLAENSEQLEVNAEQIQKHRRSITIAACLFNVFQASCVSCLILRPDLRFRGMFSNRMGLREIKTAFPELELTIMKLLILISLASPCLRARAYMAAHKEHLLTSSGLLLLISISFNLLPQFGNMIVLGSISPFLIPVFVSVSGIISLVTKLAINKDFRKWPIEEMINYIISATLFVDTSKSLNAIDRKESVREVLFHYGMNTAQWIGASIVFNSYPAFLDQVDKMDLDVSTPVLLYVLPPVFLLTSGILRALYYHKSAWSYGVTRTTDTVQSSLRWRRLAALVLTCHPQDTSARQCLYTHLVDI